MWDRARVSFPKNQNNPKKTFALEVRPEEVKILYARVLALQSLMDGRLDPREIEYLYVFMSRVRMSSGSRQEVRQTLATREASPEHVARLVEEVISAVPDNQEETSVSIIKDMVIPGQYNEPYSSAVAKNDGAWVQQFAAVIVRPDPEDGGFIATVPGRQDVVGRGKTEEAALEDARVALESTHPNPETVKPQTAPKVQKARHVPSMLAQT